ncbi:NAD(P)H-quinone oxidoreductase [Paludibacterium paludis]|uniref:NAD(P)H quinone oxidoreductase n=1 Tax=Paludibacterium paludis TaxID=1225769 RepID=A0A918UBI2_9NEIS|nr:NAD(P)H-quinone oxidoreductase [Paludibacterium paludis]GGY25368.1 NAD(P)H quinone oxidoreductase [Paludibacterium paludis]
MKAVVQREAGGSETLRLARIDKPILQDGQLLVRVMAAGVNRADIVQREGRYPAPPGASAILGLEVAGVVEEVRGMSRFQPGDAVFGLVPGGGYAEYAVLDDELAIPKPDSLSWTEAASLPEAWMTAWFNIVEVGAFREGERVLIHAGASGVGAAAIQLVRLLGGESLVSVGSSVKLDFCRSLGASQGWLRQDQPVFAELVRQWGGADLVLDPVGGARLSENLRAMNMDGRLVLIGLMGGAESAIPLGLVLMKRLTVRGSTLRNQPLNVRGRLALALEEHVLPAIAAGSVEVTVDSVFPIEAVADAHDWMECNNNLGKVVLSMENVMPS